MAEELSGSGIGEPPAKTTGTAPRHDRPGSVGTVRDRFDRLDVVDLSRRYGIIVVWLGVIAVFSVLRPDTFFTFGNLQTIAGSQAVLVVLTIGLLVPFAVGEFDVSISGTLGISLVLVGWLNVVQGWAIGWSILAALGVGLLVGAINAFFVVVARVESIVVTLGMGTLLAGVAIGINGQSTGGISQKLVDATRNELFGLPYIFYYGLLLTVIAWYVFSFTPLGRYIYFVGAGRDVARLSGIPVDRIRVGAFLVSGVVSALAGVLLAGWLGASDPNVSGTYLLPTFAAAFLGAAVIQPGRFNPWGSLIAVYFLVTGVTGLELLGLAGWIEQVFYGGSLVLAVAFSRLAGRRETR
jgi:ribose transport system permease protein